MRSTRGRTLLAGRGRRAAARRSAPHAPSTPDSSRRPRPIGIRILGVGFAPPPRISNPSGVTHSARGEAAGAVVFERSRLRPLPLVLVCAGHPRPCALSDQCPAWGGARPDDARGATRLRLGFRIPLIELTVSRMGRRTARRRTGRDAPHAIHARSRAPRWAWSSRGGGIPDRTSRPPSSSARHAIACIHGNRAARNPMLAFSLTGAPLLRFEDRSWSSRLNQEPPRITRSVPDVGPVGSIAGLDP